VGNSPFTPVTNTPPERQGDATLELMRSVVRVFESQTKDYLDYGKVLVDANISRLMFDVLIEQAKKDGLITQDSQKYLYLTAKGKQYALFHKLSR
jgi:predicted transcriptional regulator